MKSILSTFVILGSFFLVAKGQVEDFANTDFHKADSIAGLYPAHPLHDLKQLSMKLTQSLDSDQEKFRSIYKWVCVNIDNDYELFETNKRKRAKIHDPNKLATWNKKFSKTVFKTLLQKHRTVCTGYAYLLKKLTHHAGLKCEIINGYGRTAQANIGREGMPNHSWNTVQLNGKWYLCDATWSSGAIDTQSRMFVKGYNHTYFLLDPSLFVFNHFPKDTTWMLMKDKPSLQQFLNGPLVYSNALRHKVRPLTPDTFYVSAKKDEIVSFTLSGECKTVVDNAELVIASGSKTDIISAPLVENADGSYRIDHKVYERGSYAIHVLLNGNYFFTYSMKVP